MFKVEPVHEIHLRNSSFTSILNWRIWSMLLRLPLCSALPVIYVSLFSLCFTKLSKMLPDGLLSSMGQLCTEWWLNYQTISLTVLLRQPQLSMDSLRTEQPPDLDDHVIHPRYNFSSARSARFWAYLSANFVAICSAGEVQSTGVIVLDIYVWILGTSLMDEVVNKV